MSNQPIMSYQQHCRSCERRFTAAGRYCPFCGERVDEADDSYPLNDDEGTVQSVPCDRFNKLLGELWSRPVIEITTHSDGDEDIDGEYCSDCAVRIVDMYQSLPDVIDEVDR